MRIRPRLRFYLLPVLILATVVAQADDLDKAFEAQSRSSATKVTTADNVNAAAHTQERDVRARAVERESQRRNQMLKIGEAAPTGNAPAPKGDTRTSPARGAGASRDGSTPAPETSHNAVAVVVREAWQLKDEMKSITVRCPDGRERSYTWHPKTGRYCTPAMTCSRSQDWVHRSLC